MTAPAHRHGPSLFRWAGSKRQSLAALADTYPAGKHYVEPFAGSAALFFFLKPASATLADLNGSLVNALFELKKNPIDLYEAVSRIPRSVESYYEIRKKFNSIESSGLSAASYFVFLNRNCFNGLWRTNLSGDFNVPYGGVEMGEMPPLRLYEECAASLSNSEVLNQDFRKTILENSNEHSFIFADPPYFSSDTRVFVEYGKESFGKKDLDDLVELLINAERSGSTIAFSYRKDDCLKGVPASWLERDLEVTRNVGGFVGSRKKNVETLFTSVAGVAG